MKRLADGDASQAGLAFVRFGQTSLRLRGDVSAASLPASFSAPGRGNQARGFASAAMYAEAQGAGRAQHLFLGTPEGEAATALPPGSDGGG